MKKYRDEIAMACHEIVKDGHSLGIINDAEMKKFEADCFVEEPETAYNTESEPSVKLEQIA
jgi:ATP-dependent protease HslVU (ClpYQ) peptidase subunit